MITSVRLVELLQNQGNVSSVLYSKDVRKGCVMFTTCKIDVLILANHIANDELAQLSNLCKQFSCELLFLSEYTHLSYRTWCKSIGVRYLLDKASEINQVENILKHLFEN